MGLREKLNNNPMVVGIGVVVFLALAGWAVYATVTDKGLTMKTPTQYYFTTDDGQTWFPAPKESVPPFEVDGKTAVLCHVFTCDKGKTQFVGYLAKYTDSFAKRAQEYVNKAKAEGRPIGGSDSPLTSPAAGMNLLVKKPGDKEWYPVVGPKGSEVMSLWCDSRDPWDLVELYPK